MLINNTKIKEYINAVHVPATQELHRIITRQQEEINEAQQVQEPGHACHHHEKTEVFDVTPFCNIIPRFNVRCYHFSLESA